LIRVDGISENGSRQSACSAANLVEVPVARSLEARSKRSSRSAWWWSRHARRQVLSRQGFCDWRILLLATWLCLETQIGVDLTPASAMSGGAGAISEISLATSPLHMALGSDGNVWFTEPTANAIARVTPTGVVGSFSVPSAFAPVNQITARADVRCQDGHFLDIPTHLWEKACCSRC
jgi:hypothetical protein